MAAQARTAQKPRSDLYTGLLVLAFLAQIVGFTFLAIDYMSYPSAAPPKVSLKPPAAPAPQAAPQGAPVVPGQP
jgi:hypothetical protein